MKENLRQYTFTRMIKSLLLLSISIFWVFSCQDPAPKESQAQETTPEKMEEAVSEMIPTSSDSLALHEINAYVSEVEQKYGPQQKILNLNPPINNEKLVWLENDEGEVVRMIYGIQSIDPFFRHTYYLKDNEIIYYRHQRWIRTEIPRKSIEELYALKDGQLLTALGKYLEKESDERPVDIAQMPYFNLQVNQDTVLHKMHNTWSYIIKNLNDEKR